MLIINSVKVSEQNDTVCEILPLISEFAICGEVMITSKLLKLKEVIHFSSQNNGTKSYWHAQPLSASNQKYSGR